VPTCALSKHLDDGVTRVVQVEVAFDGADWVYREVKSFPSGLNRFHVLLTRLAQSKRSILSPSCFVKSRNEHVVLSFGFIRTNLSLPLGCRFFEFLQVGYHSIEGFLFI
jgi:hypothetical protein